MSAEAEVREAVAALVDDFGAGRVEAYFERLAPDATFVFHTSPERLGSRDAYRALWRRWEDEDGFAVRACAASGAEVQLLADDVAVLVHDVATTVVAGGTQEALQERETVVLQRRDGRWLVVHEHLSAMPGA